MGVMKTKVVTSSPSSSTVLSIEASKRLITEILVCDHFWLDAPQSASLRPILALAPEDGDVEINPEKEVDDGYGDEGPCSPRDCSSPFQLYPYVYEQHKADAWKFLLKLANYSSKKEDLTSKWEGIEDIAVEKRKLWLPLFYFFLDLPAQWGHIGNRSAPT